MLHYIDVDLRQERGKLCFIKRKDKVFLSDNRVVLEEKVWIFRVSPFGIKKVVDFLSHPTSRFFLRNSHLSLPTFLFSLPTSQLSRQTSQFSRSTSPLSYRTSLLSWECNAFVTLAYFVCFSATRIGASTRTRAPTSRTHRVLNSCLHPSPSPLTT